MTGDTKIGGRGQTPSQKVVLWSVGAVVLMTTVVILLAALALSSGDSGPAVQPVVAGATTTPSAASESPTGTPTGTPGSQTRTPGATSTATPPPVASSISATPSPATPTIAPTSPPVTSTPRSNLFPEAAALANSIEAQYGVRIVDSEQAWGATEEIQVRNIAAVGEALSGLPLLVRVTVNSRMPLVFLSNHTGATEAGWEPYGQREANYYTNEDVSVSGTVPSNQVVLQPGSTAQTIAHEVMHAFQMRSVGQGEYALSLLTPEMKSFMAATGWVQTGTDDEVRAAASAGWDSVNALFRYEGRTLSYTNQFGDSLTLYTPNPVEGYAEAAGLFYGHNSATSLPDWPDYWDWFRTNVG